MSDSMQLDPSALARRGGHDLLLATEGEGVQIFQLRKGPPVG